MALKKRWLARFLGKLYWFLIQGKSTMKATFEDLYGDQDNEALREIYREVFAEEFAAEADPCGFTTMTDLKNLAKCINVGEGDSLADLACGRGGSGLWVTRETGCQLTGLDLTEGGVQHARGRIADFGLEGRAQFVTGDIRSLPFQDEQFDAVMCVDSLYMIPDKQAALSEIARVLKKDRPFVCLTWEVIAPFAVADYRPLLKKAGLAPVVYEEVEGWRERQRAVCEKILQRQEILIEKLGADAAKVWIQLAKVEMPQLDKMRRVLIVANAASEAATG